MHALLRASQVGRASPPGAASLTPHSQPTWVFEHGGVRGEQAAYLIVKNDWRLAHEEETSFFAWGRLRKAPAQNANVAPYRETAGDLD